MQYLHIFSVNLELASSTKIDCGTLAAENSQIERGSYMFFQSKQPFNVVKILFANAELRFLSVRATSIFSSNFARNAIALILSKKSNSDSFDLCFASAKEPIAVRTSSPLQNLRANASISIQYPLCGLEMPAILVPLPPTRI
ncbi:hypothetical protein ENBRE01_3162 [Enteropsectra breve]|nr:hypothetical protein ENBRE01_3162 [Enteropsectra breve]